MIRNYSNEIANLSFMQIKQSSDIFQFLKMEKYKYNQNVELKFLYLLLFYKIEENNLQETVNSTNISILMVSGDT